jgi:hypothetical protein
MEGCHSRPFIQQMVPFCFFAGAARLPAMQEGNELIPERMSRLKERM